LELSPEKTWITHITDGFDLLGQNIREYKGKVIAKPSRKNIKTFLTKIQEVIKDNAHATAGHLIAILNPKIWGWANHHQYATSKKVFVKVDNASFEA
jgi:RNA-directed DNA polymerase